MGVRHGRRGWFRGDSGWGALTARRSRPLHARQEDTLLCTHSPSQSHTRSRLQAIHSHLNVYMCLCNATCPFFSSVSRSARLRLLYVHARTHLSRVRHERPSLSLSFFSFRLRFSGRALVARVRALAVTLCSFVSVSTSAESEVSDTDARSRIASFVYASRSMTVRWRIGEPWS